MLMAKLSLDLEAKKQGIAEWTYEDIPAKLWPFLRFVKCGGWEGGWKRPFNGMGIFTGRATCQL